MKKPRNERLHLFFVRQCLQWQPKDAYDQLPRGIRGIYSLHKYRPKLNKYDVVYVGMTAKGGGIKSRLRRHIASSKKDFTHFSIFQVWDNIPKEVIQELEGLFREMYSKDHRANRFNKQRRFKKMRPFICKNIKRWKPDAD